MNYLTLENVSRSYGDKVLFRDVNLQINKGEKAALIAKNGSGKSTLLRVIAGEEPSDGDTSRVLLHKGVRIGYLPQEPQLHENHTVLEAAFDSENPVVQAIKAYEWAMLNPNDSVALQQAMARMDDLKAWDFEARIEEILFRLDLTNLQQPVATLSGGQRKRLALARLLIAEPEFLILDEPTNHLDLDMIEWLEEYLKQPSLTLFMVTHDRYFMERICDNIYELDRGMVYKYTGGYSDYLEKKAQRMENEAIVHDKLQKLYRKELDWVRRSPQARTTKAQARIQRFEQIEDQVKQAPDSDELIIEIPGQRLGSKILELHYISKAFGSLKIVEDFHYKFKKGERVGIVGKNGAGKTTFLRLLTGEEKPDSGRVVVGETVVFGYYSQDGLLLPPGQDRRVIDFIQDIAEYIPLDKGRKLSAAQLLERFLFPREQHQVYISQLSGGERRRLYLLSVLMKNPNFLILDEPTNDLDVITLNVLEEWLLSFPGCLVVVSHDRFLLDKLCDHLFVFQGNGKIKDFNGRYMEYRQWVQEQEKAQRASSATNSGKSPKQEVRTGSGLTKQQKNELKKLEREIAELEQRKAELHQAFTRTDLGLDEIQQLSNELKEVEATLKEKERRWMELAELSEG